MRIAELKKFVVLLLILFIYSCSSVNDPEVTDEISLDTKIGQMLMIGFRGTSLTGDEQIVSDVKEGRVGGVILFDKDVALGYTQRNIESFSQVKELVESLTSQAEIPLLVAIDQEGGKVARLKVDYGFSATVSQEYLGTINNSDTTYYYESKTADLLNNLGINVNFAPVVDVNVNPESPAIGAIGRSFSADPNIVSSNAEIAIQAHHDKNVFTAIKHFPGHGSASSDSHAGFTDITNTWQEIELEPYKYLINNSYNDIVMTAHVFNSNLDPEYPATLSKNIITDILRTELNYNGVVVTDDMGMGAITDNFGLETAIEKSIVAGVDILLFANNLVYDEEIAVKAISIIKNLISDGTITEERINESYKRIMSLKNRML